MALIPKVRLGFLLPFKLFVTDAVHMAAPILFLIPVEQIGRNNAKYSLQIMDRLD
jgi:hypothetical protein